jgi:acyl-CoA reductase-like NAD-dependent aldehyde dehydrogenase
MERTAHGNWIGGRWTASADERAFAVCSRLDGAELGSWPRSSAADVRAALSCLARDPLGERMARKVRTAVAALPAELDALEGELASHLSDLLGLRAQEDGWRRARIEGEQREPAARGGVVVVLAHWSEFTAGLALRICSNLIAGNPVLCLSDPRLPLAAELAARALESLDLPSDLFALLHADAEDVLNELLVHEELGGLDVVSSSEQVLRLRARWGARGGFLGSSPENASAIVGAAEDPGAAARRIAEAAWGRASTLSAQLPGQVARALCHERRFSRFTEELLGELSRNPDIARPVPLIDPGAAAHVRKARDLGLDGGATLIFSERTGGPVETEFCVFTNVEPGQVLASLRSPAPVLALMRASTDEEAAQIASELDGTGWETSE